MIYQIRKTDEVKTMTTTEKDLEKIAEFRSKGYGCAQVMVAMGLWKMDFWLKPPKACAWGATVKACAAA